MKRAVIVLALLGLAFASPALAASKGRRTTIDSTAFVAPAGTATGSRGDFGGASPWTGEGTSAAASETKAMIPGETRMETVHFTIVADADDPEYLARLQTDLEKQFSKMQKEFWGFIPPDFRESHISVVSFATQEAFDDYAARDNGMPRGEKGYSSSKSNRIVYARQKLYYRDLIIITHEMTHAFNRWCAGRLPLWLDEGMAQYYSFYAGFDAGNANLKDGINPESLLAIDEALKGGTFIVPADLMAMNEDTFYSGADALHYAEAWALVRFMRKGPADDQRFTAFYADLARGVSESDAFAKEYGASPDIFNSTWLAYLDALYKDTVRDRLADRSAAKGKGSANDQPETAR
jgi:hypothetical protein